MAPPGSAVLWRIISVSSAATGHYWSLDIELPPTEFVGSRESTARVARAAFPKGSMSMRIADGTRQSMAFAGTIRKTLFAQHTASIRWEWRWRVECGSPLESALRHHRQLWHIDRSGCREKQSMSIGPGKGAQIPHIMIES